MDWTKILQATLQAVQIASSSYATYQTNRQQKKLQAEQARQTLITNNQAKATNNYAETTSSISSATGADRTIGSLKIPLSKTSTNTGSTTGIGLNIP